MRKLLRFLGNLMRRRKGAAAAPVVEHICDYMNATKQANPVPRRKLTRGPNPAADPTDLKKVRAELKTADDAYFAKFGPGPDEVKPRPRIPASVSKTDLNAWMNELCDGDED